MHSGVFSNSMLHTIIVALGFNVVKKILLYLIGSAMYSIYLLKFSYTSCLSFKSFCFWCCTHQACDAVLELVFTSTGSSVLY